MASNDFIRDMAKAMFGGVTISQLEKQRIVEILDETMTFLEAAVFDGLADEKITKEFGEVYAILGVKIDERN